MYFHRVLDFIHEYIIYTTIPLFVFFPIFQSDYTLRVYSTRSNATLHAPCSVTLECVSALKHRERNKKVLPLW